ncbi:MAG: PAS domain S-box protein [Nitrospirae bacterium]|nr:PAS domain S-box protein [Nitrospirota bacterium]
MKSNGFGRALDALLRCNKVIRENHDELLLIKDICKVIVQDVGYRMAWVGYKEEDKERRVYPVSSCGFDDGYTEKAAIVWSETERGLGPTGASARTGKPVICQNITTDERLIPWREEAVSRGYASSIALPLIINDTVTGVLTIYAAAPNAFNHDEVALLQELTESLSFGISHIRQDKMLHESEARYRGIFNGTAMPVLITNPDTLELKDVNEQACLFYGYSKDEFLKKRLSDIQTLPEEKLKVLVSEVIGKRRNYLSTRHRTLSGEIRDVEVYTGPITIQGKPYVCSTIHDITASKATEEQVNLSNEILNNMSEGVLLTRASDGIIVYTNPKFEEMTGYEHNELTGRHVYVTNAPTDIDPTEKIQKIMKVISESGQWQGEIKKIKKDGTPFWCYATTSTFEHTKHGTVWVCVHTDITDRLKLEERNKTILSTTMDGFWVLDMEGNIIQVNEAYCNMSGYTQEEMTKMRIRDIEAIETPEEIQRRVIHIAETGGDRFEAVHKRKDGSIFDVEVSVNFIKNDNVMFSFVRDITERKRMQEEIRRQNLNLQKRVDEEVAKNRIADQLMYEQSRHLSMGELLVNISHQWRQPLCAAAIAVQDLKDAYLHNELDEAYLNYNIQLAMTEIKSLSNTIDKFRNFYIETKEQKEFNIADEINKAESLMSGYVKERDIIIDKELDKSLTTQGYPGEFAHVILNILTNARDTFERTNFNNGIVRIKLYKDNATGRKVITIINNGGEIPDDIKNRVFDPYFTTKDKTRGTGMGLYTAKIIIEKHMKGAISIGNIDGWCELRIEL